MNVYVLYMCIFLEPMKSDIDMAKVKAKYKTFYTALLIVLLSLQVHTSQHLLEKLSRGCWCDLQLKATSINSVI